MLCEDTTESRRRARREMWRQFVPVYLLYFISWMFFNFIHPAQDSPLAYLLAIFLSVSMIAMIITLAVVTTRQKDEYQRQLLMRAMIWGIGGTLSVTTVCGLLEILTSVPRLPTLMNFPIFLVTALTAKLVLFRRDRPVDE